MWSQFKSSKTALKRFATLLKSINRLLNVFLAGLGRILKPLNIGRDSVKLFKQLLTYAKPV